MLVTIFSSLLYIPLGIVLLLLATIAFDVLHVCLHRFTVSSNKTLRALGALHTTHHQFLDTELRIQDGLVASNVWRHVLPEFVVQLLVTLGLSVIFPVPAVIVALFIETGIFVFIMWGTPGIDINHKNIGQLKAYRPLYFCVPEYHLLHHVYPVAYFSSWIKTLDHCLGTGTALQGRRVLLTETKTDFSLALAAELQRFGAVILSSDKKDSDNKDAGKSADILVLCHKPLPETDYQTKLEQFYQLHQSRKIPVEVWALVADTEFLDASQSAYAQFAKKLFSAEKVIYRHLVADGFPGDAGQVKKMVRNIRRGFNYVPVRFDIAMLKHYWQFVLK